AAASPTTANPAAASHPTTVALRTGRGHHLGHESQVKRSSFGPVRGPVQGWPVPTRPIARLVLGAIFLAHVAASTFAIDPGGLLTVEPFYTDDYPLHFA